VCALPEGRKDVCFLHESSGTSSTMEGPQRCTSLFVWLVLVLIFLREKYCWLIADGWFVLREK
jgi:hypothetical protein